MELSDFFKSVIDADNAPVVICNTEHKIVYMNPAAVKNYHTDLTGKSAPFFQSLHGSLRAVDVLRQKQCVHKREGAQNPTPNPKGTKNG